MQIAPRLVRCAAEPLLPEIRAAAEQAWGVPIRNVWGTSEAGGTAAGCDHSRMHLSEDLVIVEPVDDHGQPVLPGQRSAKVYLTNLYNRVLPLIRYEITDEVTVLAEPCPCGSAHRYVADIQGRLDDVFVYNGRRVHPHVFRSALARQASVIEYQVRQTQQGARIAVRCGARTDVEALTRELEDALANLGLERPAVEVRTVDRLERDPGLGKLKRFVPLQERTAVAIRQPATTMVRAPLTTRPPPRSARASAAGASPHSPVLALCDRPANPGGQESGSLDRP